MPGREVQGGEKWIKEGSCGKELRKPWRRFRQENPHHHYVLNWQSRRSNQTPFCEFGGRVLQRRRWLKKKKQKLKTKTTPSECKASLRSESSDTKIAKLVLSNHTVCDMTVYDMSVCVNAYLKSPREGCGGAMPNT